MIKGESIFSDSDLTDKAEEISKSYQKNVSYSRPQLKKPTMIKRIFRSISNTLSGDNRIGEALHGFLDLMPIPNQIIAKFFKYLSSDEPRKATEELKKLLSFRNIVALSAFILFVTGVIGIEELNAVKEFVGL